MYSEGESFSKYKNYSFNVKKSLIEKLGDVINVHSQFGKDKIIIKMNSRYFSSLKDDITIAIETEYARFFNESTTKAITFDNCQYEEVENGSLLDVNIDSNT